MTYNCKHNPITVILDDNELSISAWLHWVKTKGFQGDNSECWECYCKNGEINGK